MKFRFSIRDLLWLALVVALVVGWWLDRADRLKERERLLTDVKTLTNTIDRYRAAFNSTAPTGMPGISKLGVVNVSDRAQSNSPIPLSDERIERAMRADALKGRENMRRRSQDSPTERIRDPAR